MILLRIAVNITGENRRPGGLRLFYLYAFRDLPEKKMDVLVLTKKISDCNHVEILKTLRYYEAGSKKP